jgi:hypothetical protein
MLRSFARFAERNDVAPALKKVLITNEIDGWGGRKNVFFLPDTHLTLLAGITVDCRGFISLVKGWYYPVAMSMTDQYPSVHHPPPKPALEKALRGERHGVAAPFPL